MKPRGKRIATISGAAAVVATLLSWAGGRPCAADSLDAWIPFESQASIQGILRNTSQPGTLPGTVIASPQRENPDYYFHWVRDGALVMDVVEDAGLLMDYASLSRRQQLTPNPSGGPGDGGLGEPKFNVDGSAYAHPWGRPQNDGPALRAITLIRFARVLLRTGHADVVRARLYDGKIPTDTVIKADLEYVSHHWRESGFDLWEEILGQHFFTRMVQRRALLEGAVLAQGLGDAGAASFYRQQAVALEAQIRKHWNGSWIVPTLQKRNDPQCGSKSSDLDVAVLLGSLHGCAGDGFFCPSSDAVLATATKLRSVFEALYPINRITSDPVTHEPVGTAIGRYPEDCYDGASLRGNAGAWFLATNALAELDYRIAAEWSASGRILITPIKLSFLSQLGLPANQTAPRAGTVIPSQDPRFRMILSAIHQAGDAQLRRVKLHAGSGGVLAEQFNRETGFQQSARDLSWSYASFLSAAAVR